ncbi:MAG: ATP-dependent RNA helicase HrpA [Gammaproteobacteria bacterium]
MNAAADERDVASALAAARALLDEALARDRRRLGRRLARLAKDARRGMPPARVLARVAQIDGEARRSAATRAGRAALSPRLEWPAELPISAHVETLRGLLERHQVVVVSGATGSGKSTQIPKLCLAAGRGVDGRIGHTQPRRIAARAIAARLAAETATTPGELVGHSVRFDDSVAATTRIKVMTDGILLHEIHRDRLLDEYDTLIIDEVHERTLNIDFLLGYLKLILPRRPDLKVVVTSATLDVAAFRAFFTDAAVLDIPGRGYPVELRYRPRDAEDDQRDLNDAIVEALAELDREAPGDVLVFLPGEREIREAATHLARRRLAGTEVLQLFARLPAARQARVFEPGPERRVILATNVAETSLTVPRVRHVVDSGLARVSRYSPRRKLQQLPVEPIAQANAAQRAGRCGREAPGICIRLYGEADLAARRATIEPEIQRTHLAGVVLRMKALGIDDVAGFPFLERPAERLLKDAVNVLQEIDALDDNHALTSRGRAMTDYPLDPRLARVLLAGAELGCLREALVIVAALSIVDPRERPHELRDAADRAHERFQDKRSDFAWYLNAWPFAREMQTLPFKKQLRRCRRGFLSAVRLKEWCELHTYLHRIANRAGLAQNVEPASYKLVHQALLAGFPTLVAEWQVDHYVGCRDAGFGLHPASVLHRRGVKWILAGDVVETERPYARLAARIDPAWIERAAGHLVRRSYEAPHWDERLGLARVTEIQRLFGLVLRADRVIELARVDRVQARALFIVEGLVEGRLGESLNFLAANRARVARVLELEARARRRDLVAPPARLAAFYDARLPAEIVSRRELRRWLRGAPARAATLVMGEQDVTTEHVTDLPAWLFPDTLELAGTRCALRYRFEPGHVEDGVTVVVPLALLSRLGAAHVDRLVPGLLSGKVEALLRKLPKTERRRFSPLREFAMAAVEAIAEQPGTLAEALAATLGRMTGSPVAPGLFDDAGLEPHLRARIELVDADGVVVAAARDLDVLRAGRAEDARAAREAIEWSLGGRSQGGWSFGAVPAAIDTTVGGNRLRGFPALADCGDAVELGIYDTPEQAAAAHAQGVTRLLLYACQRELRQLERALPAAGQLALLATLFGYRVDPVVYLVGAAARRWVAARPPVRDTVAFDALCASFQAAVVAEVSAGATRLVALFERAAAIRRDLGQRGGDVPQATRADIDSQLVELLGPTAIPRIDADGAPRFDRYLDAVERRVQRVAGNPGKDLAKLDQLAPLWRRYTAAQPFAAEFDDEAARIHGLFEELRISLFAPEIGTACKVSAARVASELDKLCRAD